MCTTLTDIATAYVDDTTLTVAAIAGAATTDGEGLDANTFVGASGYNLTAVRAWTEDALAANAVCACVGEARRITREGDTLDDGFASDCLSSEAGAPFPNALFSEQISTRSIEEVGASAAGLAIGVALYNVPDVGTVAAFVGGGFYAQADPAYGAFIGCGAAIGFEEAPDDAAGATLCLAAEY